MGMPALRNAPIYVDHDGKELTALEFAQKSVDPVELVSTLQELAARGDVNPVRVSACTALLDRIWPKPQASAPLQINATGQLVINVNFVEPAAR